MTTFKVFLSNTMDLQGDPVSRNVKLGPWVLKRGFLEEDRWIVQYNGHSHFAWFCLDAIRIYLRSDRYDYEIFRQTHHGDLRCRGSYTLDANLERIKEECMMVLQAQGDGLFDLEKGLEGIEPYQAFLDSLDEPEKWQIVTLHLEKSFLAPKALINYSLFDDKAPVLKVFSRDPSYAPLRLTAGNHRIMYDRGNGERYYFDAEVQCWFQF